MISFSFRVLALTVIVFIFVNYGNMLYPVYISAPLAVIKKVCNDLIPFITSRDQELKYTYPPN